MWAWRVALMGLVATGLILAAGCGHQSTVPVTTAGGAPSSGDEQLPFDRVSQQVGISPTSAVIPPGARIPAGTPMTVRVGDRLSSARVRSGDLFHAALDEPIIVNGQTIAERGAVVTGRIVESAPARNASNPGYMRLTLTSILIGGKPSPVQTSSNFVKGPHSATLDPAQITDDRGTLMGAKVASNESVAIVPKAESRAVEMPAARNAAVGPDSRLTFRLMESVPLHSQEAQ